HGDPASIASHHLHYHHTIVSFGSGVHTVNGFRGDIDSSIKSKSKSSAGKIVVDGFGNSYDLDALFVQFLRDGKRVVATDGDQSIDIVQLQARDALFQSVGFLARVGARRSQNGAATGQYSAHTGEIQWHAL